MLKLWLLGITAVIMIQWHSTAGILRYCSYLCHIMLLNSYYSFINMCLIWTIDKTLLHLGATHSVPSMPSSDPVFHTQSSHLHSNLQSWTQEAALERRLKSNALAFFLMRFLRPETVFMYCTALLLHFQHHSSSCKTGMKRAAAWSWIRLLFFLLYLFRHKYRYFYECLISCI